MTKFILSILLAVITQTGFSQIADVEELKKINLAWLNSYPKKDATTLAKIFAEDFVLISPHGVKMTKNDIINNLDKQEIASVVVDSIDVRLLTKETGLITAYTTFVLRTDNKEVVGKNCYQDVYIKRKGKWVAVAAHVTLLSTQ